jgi:putative tricarboxylic transport membrane protein
VTFPDRPVRLVLGFSPGSASDEIARALVPAWAARLGCTVTIELRPGANGAKAAREVAASAPDGHTLFMATLGTHALAPHLPERVGYDPLRDFVPVSLIARSPLVLACHAGVPASSTRELIDLARADPGALTYGTSAIGGAPHLAAELFQAMAGVVMRHVRYDTTEQLYEDLEAGMISLSFNNIMSMLRHCRNGQLRAVAVSGATRSTVAPELPTIAESGVPGYEISNWLGIVAPRGTPDHLVAALRDALAGVSLPQLSGAGVEYRPSTPQEFGQFIAREIERWGPVVRRFSAVTQDRSRLSH